MNDATNPGKFPGAIGGDSGEPVVLSDSEVVSNMTAGTSSSGTVPVMFTSYIEQELHGPRFIDVHPIMQRLGARITAPPFVPIEYATLVSAQNLAALNAGPLHSAQNPNYK